METRSIKRRRLITISTHVSSWPNVPARFESLNDDTLTTVLEFLGNKSYATYARINKHCKEIYLTTKGMTKETFLYGYGPLTAIKESIERAIEDNDWDLEFFEAVGKGVVLYNRRDVLEWGIEEQNKYVLKGICCAAATEGRIDTLVEVWNNVEDEDDDEYIFGIVDRCAAQYYAARGGVQEEQLVMVTSNTAQTVEYDTGSANTNAGEDVTVMGWGTTSSGGSSSDVLLEVEVDIVSNSDCKDAYGSSITDVMMCAARDGKDSCQGDSGGPLVIVGSDASSDVQVGIVSWGAECADPDYPGVYARVSEFADFIDCVLNGGTDECGGGGGGDDNSSCCGGLKGLNSLMRHVVENHM